MSVVTKVDEPLCIETSMLPKWKLDAADWRKYEDENSVYDDNIQNLNDNVIEMVNKAAIDAIRRAIYDRNRARKKMSRANMENYEHLKGVVQHIIKESAEAHWLLQYTVQFHMTKFCMDNGKTYERYTARCCMHTSEP